MRHICEAIWQHPRFQGKISKSHSGTIRAAEIYLEAMKICIEQNVKSGGYLEFLPGEYKQTHWNEDSIFLGLEVFQLIEVVFKRNLRGAFSPYGCSRVTRSEWEGINGDLRNLSLALRDANNLPECKEKLYFSFPTTRAFEENFEAFKDDLVVLIDGLVQWVNRTLVSHELITILGV